MAVTPKELFKAGKVSEAVQMLTAYLRDHPADTVQRTFLFELLCFSGEYFRAEKQLAVLGTGSQDKEMGAIVYCAALHAERTRHELFERKAFPSDKPLSRSGTLNGKQFEEISDANPDIAARLEVFAAGSYVWIPFEHLASVEMGPPQRLRDTLWAPALVQTGSSFRGKDLGEVLIPAIYPFSWKHEDENVWLGRVTDWAADEKGKEIPAGQKMLLIDGEEFPFLEIRSLQFSQAADTSAA